MSGQTATAEMTEQEKIYKLADELGILREIQEADDQLKLLREHFRGLTPDAQQAYIDQGWVPKSLL